MAIRFNASADRYRRTTGLPSIQNFTVCGWSKFITDRGDVAQGMVTWEPEVLAYITWRYGFGDSRMAIGSFDGGTENVVKFTNKPALGAWFFWYLRCSGSGANLLQGGWAAAGSSAFTEQRSTTIRSGTGTAIILAQDSYGGWTDQAMAGVKVWGAALTDAELLLEMQVLRPVRFADLNAWTPFIDATVADNANDLSGNGRNWTAGGTLTVEQGPPVGWGGRGQRTVVPSAVSYTLTADNGSIALTGQDAALNVGRSLLADYAAFALAGQAADLRAARVLPGDQGAFALGGQDATLSVMRMLIGDNGAFSLSGQDAALTLARVLTAANGAFVLNGQDVALLRALAIAGDYGAFSVNGQDASFALGQTLPADYGSFALSGQDAALALGRLLPAEEGLFTLSGQSADLLTARLLTAGVGAFVLSGQDAALAVTRLLEAQYGVFALAGQDAIIDLSTVQGYLAAVEQQDVALIYGNVTGTGQFTVSGPYVIQAFPTDALSFPYDVRQRTA